jgi:hypothetical protein
MLDHDFAHHPTHELVSKRIQVAARILVDLLLDPLKDPREIMELDTLLTQIGAANDQLWIPAGNDLLQELRVAHEALLAIGEGLGSFEILIRLQEVKVREAEPRRDCRRLWGALGSTEGNYWNSLPSS